MCPPPSTSRTAPGAPVNKQANLSDQPRPSPAPGALSCLHAATPQTTAQHTGTGREPGPLPRAGQGAQRLPPGNRLPVQPPHLSDRHHPRVRWGISESFSSGSQVQGILGGGTLGCGMPGCGGAVACVCLCDADEENLNLQIRSVSTDPSVPRVAFRRLGAATSGHVWTEASARGPSALPTGRPFANRDTCAPVICPISTGPFFFPVVLQTQGSRT